MIFDRIEKRGVSLGTRYSASAQVLKAQLDDSFERGEFEVCELLIERLFEAFDRA